MEKVSADALRSAAPNWSLGGDKQLLDILQNIHQKIMTKCTETNAKLEELVDSLDTASVDLQNVNNKFMALSNSQFVECRVYDDDIDLVNEVAVPKEQPKQVESKPEIPNIKESLLVIESMHEQVQILDSDTSDDEDEGRIILKPKDMYHQRPLPYIIGSQMWKKKWHAGLVVEDSDTDSTGSKPAPREEYSDSEPEVTDTQTDKQHDITISSSNTSVEVSTSIPQKPVKPADVAAELARRLGGDAIPPPPTIPEDLPPPTGKVYRPEQPTRATIFSNEPPPLEQYESSSEDDIFAELHKKPYPHSNRVENRANVVDELFGNSPEFLDKITNTMDKRPVFEDEFEPELFVEKPKPKTPEPKEDSFKKPVGGISLFGSNKDSNSIGAAILKRNQRKSSSEEEEIPETQPAPKANKNIIEDLFVKPKNNKVNKQINKEVKKDKEINIEQKVEQKKVDLFSDDLFDDIDDIFTSKVVTKKLDKKSDVKEKSKEKSIFDSDDELFSDIKVKENVTESKVTAKNNIGQKNKVVFDENDDNLFSEESIPTKTNKTEKESNLISKTNKAKSIFDDDTDDELFKNDDIKSSNLKNNVIKESAIKTNTKKNSIFDDSDDELFSEPKSKSNIEVTTSQLFKEESIKEQKKEDIFNDKLGFENKKESEDIVNKPSRNNTIASEIKKKRSSLFDDDSEEELFSGKNSSQKEIDKSVHTVNSNKDFEIGENKKQDENICDKNTLEIPTETVTYDLNEPNIPEKQEIIDNIIDEKTVELDKNQNTPLDSKNDKLSIIKNKPQFQSPSLFDDDEMDDLFSNNKKQTNKTSDTETSNHSKVEIENSVPIKSKDAQNVDNKKIINTVTDEENIFDKTPQPPIPDISSHEIEDNILDEPPEWTSEVNEVKESDIIKPITEKHEILNETTKEERKNESTLLDSKIDVVTESIIENETEKLADTENTEKPKEPSIFSDIFNDMPPEFEKPKEPKKSKNVNALFDDDSDDETFFKKSDVINEDLPSPSYDTNERFSIFHDEPPAIDVDFVPKPVITTKTIDIEDDFDIYDKDNLQQDSITKEKIDVFSNRVSEEIKSESILKTSKNDDEKRNENLASLEDSIRSTNAMITEKINKMQSDIQKTDDTEAKLNKNIGKLKPVNFNINVNTLLPGASPKKTKPIEDVDGVISSKLPETTNQNTKETSEKVKEVKTVNFEDEKDSEILNNKISKERAKIQVKRRPSTRRARKEAARKSGIDFGDTIDSSDNSSCIEEPAKSQQIVGKKDSNIDTDNIKNSTETKTENVDKNINDIANESSNVRNNNEEITSHDIKDSKLRNSNKNVTSKVVYILNDEDIFSDVNTNPEHKTNSKIEPSSSTDKKLDDNHNPNTDKKASIFDLSDSDSELFGAKKVTVTPKAKLFESDSDDELFGGNSKKERKIVKEEVKPKGSLFGDESDDDIFSTKAKKKDEKLPSRETTNTTSKPVFEDPLSMLTQEDD